jgi:hypothetical protein
MAIQRAGELQIEQALTNFSIGYKPANLIADKILPIIAVGQETGVYYEWDKGLSFMAPPSLRADGTRPNTVQLRAKKVSFSLEEYALEIGITDREENAAPGLLQLRQAKTKRAQDAVLIDYERRVATMLRTSLPGETLSGTAQWSSSANTDIEAGIDRAKSAIRAATGGMEPNVIIVPREVSRFAKRNAAIRDLIKYTNPQILVNGDLPPSFFGLTVWTPGAYQDGSPTADNITEVWGNDVIVAYIPGTPMLDTPALGYTFRMDDFTTYTWREDALTTNWIRPSVMQTEKLTFAAAGYILRSAI